MNDILSKPSVPTLVKIFEYMLFQPSNQITLPQGFSELNFLSGAVYSLNKTHMQFVMLGNEAHEALSIILSRFPVISFYREFVILSTTPANNSMKLLVEVPEIFAIEMNHCVKFARIIHLDENELDYDPYILTHFFNFEEIEFFHQGGVSEPGQPEEDMVLENAIEMITRCITSKKLQKLKYPGQTLAACAAILSDYYLDELYVYPENVEFLVATDYVLKVGILHYDTYYWTAPNFFYKVDTEDVMINVKFRFERPLTLLKPCRNVRRVHVFVDYNLHFEHVFAFCAQVFPNLDSLTCKTTFALNVLSSFETVNPVGEVSSSVRRCFAFAQNCERSMIDVKNQFKQKAKIIFRIAAWWPTFDVMPVNQTEAAHAICTTLLSRYNQEYSTLQTSTIFDEAPLKRLENGITRKRFYEELYVILQSVY